MNMLEQLLRSARYNVTQIDADLSGMQAPFSPSDMYHQGYQLGRKTELESLITMLQIMTQAATPE